MSWSTPRPLDRAVTARWSQTTRALLGRHPFWDAEPEARLIAEIIHRAIRTVVAPLLPRWPGDEATEMDTA